MLAWQQKKEDPIRFIMSKSACEAMKGKRKARREVLPSFQKIIANGYSLWFLLPFA
jgi:hypothetical protein